MNIYLKIFIFLTIFFGSDLLLTIAHEDTHAVIAEYHGYEPTVELNYFNGNPATTSYIANDKNSTNYKENDRQQAMVDIIGYPLHFGLLIIIGLLTVLILKD